MTATTAERGRDIVLRGRSLRDVLRALAKLAEAELPGAIAGFTLMDPTGTFVNDAVFPSLAPVFERAIISIPVAAHAGTCVEAIRAGTAVISNDILGDIRFDQGWRDLCLRSGIKSIQSVPIRASTGATEGTFVLGYREPWHDARWNAELMQVFAVSALEAIRLYRILSVGDQAAPQPRAC